MNIKQAEHTFATIRPGDNNFTFWSGFTLVPRAHLEFSEGCPDRVKRMVQEAFNSGWLKPVANIEAKKETWLNLKGNDNV